MTVDLIATPHVNCTNLEYTNILPIERDLSEDNNDYDNNNHEIITTKAIINLSFSQQAVYLML